VTLTNVPVMAAAWSEARNAATSATWASRGERRSTRIASSCSSRLDGTSLQLVADQAGWSIGSLRHYFASKADLLVFALRHAADRIEERIGRLPASGTVLGQLRAVLAELLPLDTAQREEALVWLAFIARATTDPSLAPEAEDVWRQLHDPLVARITEAIRSGELPAQLDAEREATRLQALIDGLVVHMVQAPRHVPPELALAVVDHHLATLRADDGPDLHKRAGPAGPGVVS
jgi:AcrR family transcriptional regulator